MDKFCGRCGSRLNPADGTCPKCNKEKKKPVWLNVTKLNDIAVWLVAVIVILVIFMGSVACITKRNTAFPDATEQKEIIRQLSGVRHYDESKHLKTEINFTYEQQKVTHILIKSYDESGLEISEQEYPIEYDTEGRLTRYGIMGTGRYEEFEYDEEGTLIRHGEGEGGYIETFFEYDAQGRVEETMTTGEGANFVSHYVYDNAGRCTRRDDYTYYDATYYEDRTYDLEVYHYKYDKQGNLTEISGDSTVTTYEYDNHGRKASEVIKDEYGSIYTTLYCYDYTGLTLCDINYNNSDDFNSGYCIAELRGSNDFLIYSYPFDTGSVMSADENGYLIHIEEPSGESAEFLYRESE